MNFNGEVTYFNSSNHSYLVNFKLISENLSIPEGCAYIRLKIGDTKINIHNSEKYPLDKDVNKFLKSKFLETIYNYNVSRLFNTAL